jgi:pimeloyl-ACP methyl ester carboxylesterase
MSITIALMFVGVMAASDGGSQREVVIPSEGASIAATILVPGSSGSAPGVVIVHGSGESDRSNAWTEAWASGLVKRGIAVLHPDKRGCGKSTGDWRKAGFDLLGEDAARAVELLRAQPEVDATNVGVIGFSQGVDVAPVCASRPDAPDFVIAVSGSTVPLLEQVVHEIDLEAARGGEPLSTEALATVTEIHRLALAFALSGSGFDALQEKLERAATSGGALGKAVSGVPRNRDHWLWGWMRAVGDFDPLPFWQKVEGPMLFVYGGKDTQVKAAVSVERLRRAFEGSDKNWSVLELARNGHALVREDVLDFAARWIRDRGAP